jgi:hypothetical protein
MNEKLTKKAIWSLKIAAQRLADVLNNHHGYTLISEIDDDLIQIFGEICQAKACLEIGSENEIY